MRLPLQRMNKVADALGLCSRSLKLTRGTGEPSYQQFVENTRQTLERFQFELRTELKRLAAVALPGHDHKVTDFQTSLEITLHHYHEALKSKVPPHGRAMLSRQFEAMKKVYVAFLDLSRAA